MAETNTDRPLKILFFPLGWVLAHVTRSVSIAKALRDLGHEVVFAGHDPDHPRSYLDHVRTAGFEVVHVREPMSYLANDRFQKYGIASAIWDCLRLHRWAPIDKIVEDMVRVCKEQQPDLVVGDASIGASTAAHITGIPAAGIINAYNNQFYQPGSHYRLLIQFWDWLVLARIRARAYRSCGVQPVNALDLLESIPLISPDLEEFTPDHDGFPHWNSVGPIVTEPPVELPEWYDELDDGTPNIYITMGSTGPLNLFLKRCFGALGELPYRFVVTTSGMVEEEVLAQAPPNFRFAKHAPGSKLMERSQALIFHGGNGTLYQGLAAGLPMIALPVQLEAELCAKYITKHQFGLVLPPRKATGPEMVKAIATILETPHFRENAQRLAEQVQASTAPETAAKILAEHARNGEAAGAEL